MKNKTINKFKTHLENLLTSTLTRTEYCKQNNLCINYFSITFKNITNSYNEGKIDRDLYTEIKNLFDKSKLLSKSNCCNDLGQIKPITETNTNDRGDYVEYERDDKGKIKYYKFKVFIRDKEPLVGKLSRDDMNLICRTYSYYGESLTQREVSRYFPEYSLIDFKRILRVFNITKASSPLAPHIIEEHSKDELLEIRLREKENDFLKLLERQRVKDNEKLVKTYATKIAELENQINNSKSMFSELDLSKLPKCNNLEVNKEDTNKDLFIWLSDMHVGAKVSSTSIYNNTYDEIEISHRLNCIVSRVAEIIKDSGNFDNIIVCNLGDSLDGMDQQTARRDHLLPQNMSNKEQVQTFLRVMTAFFINLKSLQPKNIKYYCVGESNHDGILGYTVNLALGEILTSMNMEATIFNTFIGKFVHKNINFLIAHGKDDKDMKKNMPLTLDLKTENFINEYLDSNSIKGEIIFVKGDLHQSATSYGRRFKYQSVGSLFGGSEWVHKNFGNTPWSCDYSILDSYGYLHDGRIEDE